MRVCEEGEGPTDFYFGVLAPALSVAAATLPFWAYLVHLGLKGGSSAEAKGEEVTICQILCLPEVLLFKREQRKDETPNQEA